MGNKELWEQRHKNSIGRYNRVTDFARFCYDNFLKNKKGKLLDLGCGKGSDSIFFHFKDFAVTAVDYSSEAIKQFNFQQNKNNLFITSLVKDMAEGFSFEDSSFDIVYSRLGLDYLTDEDTKKVFSEIKRILKSEGYFLFQVKSNNDQKHGQGKEIEKDMYEDEDGYARHFISQDYAKELLDGFEIIFMDEKKIANGNAYLDVIAKKK
ncbi:MAG: class I SAM-dependent methyltransferase [Nanoarchaeota archaeon]|nr:class I SAM-dependent methyltransferase [Nanoarchaeota archaeon]